MDETKDLKTLQDSYWLKLNETMEQSYPQFSPKAPYKYEYHLPVGNNYAHITLKVNSVKKIQECIIVISHNKALFDKLKKSKDEIESNLGFNLYWDRKTGVESKIGVTRDFNIRNESEWDDAVNWHLDIADKFFNVFSPRLNSDVEISLREDLKKVLDEYLNDKKENGTTSSPIAHYIKKDIPEHFSNVLGSEKYRCGSSAGIGNLAEIPRIDFGIKNLLDKNNIDVTYFFKSDMGGVYLVLRVFYYADLEKKFGKYLPEHLKTKARHVRNFINDSEFSTETYQESIDLFSNNQTSKLHRAGVIYSKFYEKSNLPSEEELRRDLFEFLNILETVLNNYSDNMYLTVDEWINALEDENLINSKVLNILEINYNFENHTACFDDIVEERRKLGFSDEVPNSYTSPITYASKRLKEYFNKTEIYGSDDKEIWYPRFFYGERKNNQKGNPVFYNTLREELVEALENYDKTKRPDRIIMDMNITGDNFEEDAYDSFQEYLQDKGYYFDKETIENYLLSLKVKPFVILTGNSGTGKTKLSQLFAEYLMGTNYYPIKVTTRQTSWCIKKDGKPSNEAGWTVENGYESFKAVLPLDNIVGEYEIEINDKSATAKLTFFPQLYYDTTSNEKLRNHFKKLYSKEEAAKEYAEENKLPKPPKQYVDLYIDYNDLINVMSKEYVENEDIILNFRVKTVLAEKTVTASFDIFKYIPFEKSISCNILSSGIYGEGTFQPKFRFNPTLTPDIRTYLNSLLDDAEKEWREENREKIENEWDDTTTQNEWKKVANNITVDVKIKNFNFSFDDFTPNLSNIKNFRTPNFKTEDNYAIVPVGSNWTENRNVVGYYNVLTHDYQHTQSLDLLLKAEGKTGPYFLILDEMNLSHVERYFSDFLSSMESGKKIPLHKAGEEYSGKVPNDLKIPENMFIIGTVNVDETTYMFSPKVLDRANVLEFKTFDKLSILDYINDTHPEVNFKGDVDYLMDVQSDRDLRENILSIINDEFSEVKFEIKTVRVENEGEENKQEITEIIKGNVLDEIINTLNNINLYLKGSGFEFGYRTVNEILAFMYVAWKYEYESQEWNEWKRYLDAQILQKVLPKLHGSQMVLGETLDNLLTYCLGLDSIDDAPELEDIDDSYPYPESAKKLMQMKEVLEKQRYVSFIN